MKVKFNIKNINLEPKINPVSALSFEVRRFGRWEETSFSISAGSGKRALVKEYLKIILVAQKMMPIATFGHYVYQ
jgi:hypothetical protein